jgi:septal ring factor EnvC (AmiA/AmiB activator)
MEQYVPSTTTPWQAILFALVSLALGWLTYRGVKLTANKAKEGSQRSTAVAEQESALNAWQAMATEMVDPIRKELKASRDDAEQLRRELDDERKERKEREKADERDRAEAKRLVAEQMTELQEQVDKLRDEVKVWKRVAQTIARWATALRDEVLRLGGTVPATPEELLTLNAIQDHEES